MATAKGIAAARGLPLVGVPSLESMAWQLRDRAPEVVCPVLDARRGQVYAAIYRTGADSMEQVEGAFLARPGQLVERVLAENEPVTIFGQADREQVDEMRRALGNSGGAFNEEEAWPDALAAAQLGSRRHLRHGGEDIASLRPIYVRMSYAEERFDIDLGLR
jgi:tRNA threonylcarbamoyladenosine biosynthesis protein TsaB